jgi:iron complex transport system substrate-binding protein
VRICSLVPAATEILFALGLGDQVVGVTHESDWPPEAAQRPAVTAALVETAELTSVEIDQAVADAAGNGKPLYAVDADVWAQINADVVIAQELCEVCAVSTDQLDEIVTARSSTCWPASSDWESASAPRAQPTSSPAVCAAGSTGCGRRWPR